MQWMRRVALNGIQLDELDERIIVCGVEEEAAAMSFTMVSRYGAPGQRIARKHRDTLDVKVKFGIRITKRDLEARNEVFEKVAGWASNSGWLEISYKPNRRLRVVCVSLPAMGDPAKWNSEYEITFRATTVPFWQQITPNTVTVASTKSVTRNMDISGTMDSVLDVDFTNTSGMTINTLTLTTRESTFDFKSLGLAANETLMIDHTVSGLLRIRIKGASGTRSAMNKRTPESSDELVVSPGTAQVTMTAQRVGKLVLSCAGRYV